MDASTPIEASATGLLIRLKVVPGASRTRLAGLLGDRLKIHVAAPPEGGKANRAVCQLLAEILGVPTRQVSITAGHSQPVKTALVTGLSPAAAATALHPHLPPLPRS